MLRSSMENPGSRLPIVPQHTVEDDRDMQVFSRLVAKQTVNNKVVKLICGFRLGSCEHARLIQCRSNEMQKCKELCRGVA